jgi:hypothetical protein
MKSTHRCRLTEITSTSNKIQATDRAAMPASPPELPDRRLAGFWRPRTRPPHMLNIMV